MPRGFSEKRYRDEYGFTLIEIIIVLAVVLIVAAAALPLASSERRSLYNAGVTLQGDIRYAQRLSIIEGRNYQVKFNQSANKYTIQYRIAGTSKYKQIKEVYLHDEVKIKSVNTEFVEYGPKGTNNKAFTLVLQNNAYTMSITANVGAGRIDLKDIKKN